MSSPVEPASVGLGELSDADAAGPEATTPVPAPTASLEPIDGRGRSLDSAVSGSILTLRLREARRAEGLVRLGTLVLSLWAIVALWWAAWTLLDASGSSAASREPWAWFWAGSGTVLLAARAWLADRRDARLRGAAQAWVRSARAGEPVTAFPEGFRDAFCRSDRVLDLVAGGLLLAGGTLALTDAVRVIANYAQDLPVAWQPSMTLAVVLLAVGTCVLSVSGSQGRRRARELRDLRRWRQ